MIRSVFDRPMFRNPNIRRSDPSGIMASSPELIRVGTAEASQINPTVANEFKVGKLKSIYDFTIPFYGQRKPLGRSNTEIDAADFEFGRVTPVTAKGFGAIPGSSAITEEVGGGEVTNIPPSINDTTQNILNTATAKKIDDEAETYDGGDIPVSEAPFTSNVKPKPEDTTKKFDFKDIKKRTATEIQGIQNLYSTYATDLDNLDNANILGKTYDKHKEEYIAALQKKPEEATFGDVRDAAFDLLGYDKDKLDENLSKDQQGSVWLNMMRAGLAMAAGESENALTNVAKGFQVGLEGYGRDMKDLSDDYREDVKTYQSTMYKLLADKKSENIAKNALDVQRKAAEFNIVQQTRGEERKDLLDKLNTEVAMRKIKIESLATMANYDLEKFKLDKSDSEFQNMLEIHKAKIAALLPDEIQAAVTQGLVKIKDESKLMTAENLELTQKGINQQFDLLKELKDSKVTRPTESMQKINIAGRKGGFGMQAAPGTELSASVQEELGLTLQNLTASTSPFQKALDPFQGNANAALGALITAFKPLREKGVILKYDDMPEIIKNAIETGDADTVRTYQNNADLFVGSPGS
jgi:hypothetical protein